MGFARHLWHMLTCAAPALPDGAFPAPAQPAEPRKPPNKWYRLREEVELALLVLWLPEAARPRFVGHLIERADRYLPWSAKAVEGEPWEQCRRWGPLVIKEPETMSVEGLCHVMEAELTAGLQTYTTPREMLSRPVRMLWLLKLGRRAGQAYAGLEQALGGEDRALEYAWWTITKM